MRQYGVVIRLSSHPRLGVTRSARSGVLSIGVAIVVALGLIVTPAAPATAANGDFGFSGHGWGHGRGMGQYGAYGYAVDHGWGYAQILGHYYGGTSLAGDAGNPAMTVELTRFTGVDTIVTAPGLTVNGVSTGSAAVLVRRTRPGVFAVFTGNGCAGPWTSASDQGSGLVIASTAPAGSPENLLRTCEATTTHGYRGTITVVDNAGTQYAVNTLWTDDYLRGVVPRESPSSWGTAGGGRGMEALKAQAVAARSYALASGGRASGAKTCDTTACQVYSGAVLWPWGGAMTVLDAATTDSAVAQTSGQVMRWPNGTIARTEFSSSTGGWTAGGAFLAVVDEGDDTALNPNHNWTMSFTAAEVASALGTGAIRSLTVTGRNGAGADGGRVTEVTVITTAGATRTFSGAAVRSALGLKSDWFSVSGATESEARSVVTALYHDVLGREPDSTGLSTWTAEIVRTGNASSTAAALAGSRERLAVIVAAQYQAALGRQPEAAGSDFWVHLFEIGWNVPDLQAGIYASDEAFARLGQGDPLAWVAAIYRDILHRTATPDECRWWIDYAARNGRQAAVMGITRSQEAALFRLAGYYSTMLGRAPDPTGVATFVPVLMVGRGDLSLPALIGQSTEYWLRAQARYP